MLEFECPHCHLPLSVDEPDYKRVVCAHCRQIIEVPQDAAEPVDPAVAAAHFGQVAPAVKTDDLELAQPEQKPLEAKPSGSKSSARSAAQRPGVGSGARHATLKNRARPAAQPKQSIGKTVAIAAALLIMVSVTAFALTRALGTTQAAVASAETDGAASKKNASAASSTDTHKKASTGSDGNAADKKVEALHSPKEFEKLATTPPETPKAAEQPKPEPLKENPAPPAAEPAAPEPVKSAQPVEPPAKKDEPAAAAPQPEKNINDLLNTRTTKGKQTDDEEELVASETAAREAKHAAEKPKDDAKQSEESRVKFKPDNPFVLKDGPEAPANAPAKPDTAAAKNAAAEATKAKAVLPELPPVCATCMGTGHVPVMAPRKLVRTLKDPVPPAPMLAPWKQCPTCKAGNDDKALADAEAARMKDPQTLATHEQWAQMVNGKLESIETRHVSVRSQLSLAQNKIVGDALEQLTEHLQRHTKLTVLTPTRPDTHELFLFSDRAAFETIRDSVGSNPDFDKAQLAKISGVSMRNKGLYHLQPQQKPENMALFLFGRMTMTEVTDGKGPFWLVEGFAAYCENTVMKKNLCYSITYEVNDVKFSPNWDDDIRKYAAKRQLKPWKDIFPATGMLMKPLEYLTCYSMVSFLIKTDPQRFNKLVLAIREGHESPVALKMAYGRDVDELQRLWAMWALTAK